MLLDARDVKGVGAANGVIVLRELGGQPLPGQRRFEPDRHRARHCAKPRDHGLDCRRQLPDLRDDLTGGIEGTGGDLALMDIEAKERHGRLPHRLR